MAVVQLTTSGLAGALLMLGATQAPSSPPEPIAPEPTPETLVLAPEQNTRVMVPVRINGSAPVDFIIDTGSQATVVTDELREVLGLPIVGRSTVAGVASSAPVSLARVGHLAFGTVSREDIDAPILQRRHIGADGMLGLDALSGLRIQIDFQENRIEVLSATARRRNTGYEFLIKGERRRNQLLLTHAKVDGIDTVVVIDTGAQQSIGNDALRRAIARKRGTSAIVTDVNGSQLAAHMVLARKLEIGHLSLSPMPIAFADSPSFETLGIDDVPALSLGMEQLQAFDRIAIDFTAGRVLFDIPDTPFTTGTILRN